MKKFYKIILTIIILNFICNISMANTNNIKEIEYSLKYTKWLELSDEEKENSIMPSMYTINLDDNYNLEAGANEENLPTSYNTADYINITVRDQGITDSCWAISSIEMAEITYARLNNKNNIIPFSSRHVDYSCSRYFENGVENLNGFNRKVGSGGRYEYAMAYFSSGKGPILENDMPFVNNKELVDISEIQNKTVHAQLEDYTEYPQIYKSYNSNNEVSYSNGDGVEYTEIQINEFRNTIKRQIKENGAVGAYTRVPTSKTDINNYFSNENNSAYGKSYYCNNTELNENHTICIVGWDDTYSKTNFKEGCQPANDGAYIALNSYGADWQEDGYYYISYDDYFIENGMFGIQNISDVDYNNIYQYDNLGKNYKISSSYDNTYIYGANVFKKEDNDKEKLTEIGIYIYENNTDVTIYINNFGDKLDITNLQSVTNVRNLTVGYHVIKLDTPILIGNTFSIIVKYSNENLSYLPIEANYSSIGYTDRMIKYNTATSNLGESYYSVNGVDWNDLYKFKPDANVCIKAFTIDISKDATNTGYILNKTWKVIDDDEKSILYGIEEGTTINELLSSSNFSNNYTVKAYKNGSEITTGKVTTGTVIKIFDGSNIIKEYTIVIYGDTNLDGNIASIDALTIVKHKLGIESFKNKVCEEAGKVTLKTRTLDLTPSAVDALAVVKHKLGISTISQY